MIGNKEKKVLLAFLAVLSVCLFLSGCGKEKDPKTTEVMKLSVTPEETPTPTPKVINDSAVTTSGELTMVNEYRVSEDTKAAGSAMAAGNTATEGAASAAAGELSGADVSGDSAADSSGDTDFSAEGDE